MDGKQSHFIFSLLTIFKCFCLCVVYLLMGKIKNYELQEEVKTLGRISHPNLVKIKGYCCEEKKSLVVLDYLHNKSLEHHISGS